MERLSRIQISNQLLDELYDKYKSLSDEELSTTFYSFLVSDNDEKGVTQSICLEYNVSAKDLQIRKNDIILEIVASGYGYLRYAATFCELPLIETEILKDLDNLLSYSIKDIIEYFKNPSNQEKMKLLIIDYCVCMTQDADFIADYKLYLYNEPTEFYQRIKSLIGYVEVMDIIAIIHEEIMRKYESGEVDEYELFSDSSEGDDEYEEEGEEEYPSGGVLELASGDIDEDEDSYEDMIIMQRLKREQEDLFATIIEFLEDYYQDKFAADDFIGYFMSFVYALLLKERQEQPMAIEDEELLRMLSRKELSFEYAVEMFYASKEYVFSSIDLFVQEYYVHGGDIFSIRENFSGKVDNDRFNILDSYYIGPEPNYKIIYIGSPLSDTFAEMLLDIKTRNPDDTVGEIYQLLLDPNYDCSLFEKFGFDKQNLPLYKRLMMRFLARKYVESVCFKQVSSFSLEELYIYQGLMHIEVTDKNIEILFSMGYYFMIPAYYEMLEKGEIYEKCIIRKLKGANLLANMVKIDSSCLGETVYRKALQESEFYAILETNGITTTISYLNHLSKMESGTAMDYLKELLLANYYYAKEENLEDALSHTIIRLMDGDTDIHSYLHEMIQNKDLLEELLKRYLAQETKAEYPLSYHEKLEQAPKIKQKLYPRDIKEG